MDALWFPGTPALDPTDGGELKGTPSTIFTDEDEADTSTIADLSRQSSVTSFASEYSEDSFSPNMIYQTFKAEFTGDYSHLRREGRKSHTPRKSKHSEYRNAERNEYRNAARSPYSPYSATEDVSGHSSFPRDDGSPAINLHSPHQLDDSPSPSREMRRLVYSASRTQAPRQQHEHDAMLSYSTSPQQSLSMSSSRRARSLPVVSPVSMANRVSRGYHSLERAPSISSPTSIRRPLKQASPGARGVVSPSAKQGVVEVKSLLLQEALRAGRPLEHDVSIDSVATSEFARDTGTRGGDNGGGTDVPFDEIDFFDWNSVKVHQAFESDQPFDSLQASPSQQSYSSPPTASLLERSEHRSMTLSERLAERGIDTTSPSATKKSPNLSVDSTLMSPRKASLERSFSVPDLSLSTTYFEPSSGSLMADADSPATALSSSSSPEEIRSKQRACLPRSQSWRELSASTLSRRSLMNRSKSFTVEARVRRNEPPKAPPLDTVDVLAPKVLSFEKEDKEKEEDANKVPVVETVVSKDTSRDELSFLSSKKPTLSTEQFEVALSDAKAPATPTARPGMNRSHSMKVKRSHPQRQQNSMKRSESFTLRSRRNNASMSSNDQFKVALSETKSTKTLAPQRPGLNRSQSMKVKRSHPQHPRSSMQRSESFTLGSKRKGVSKVQLDNANEAKHKLKSVEKQQRSEPLLKQSPVPVNDNRRPFSNDANIFPFSTSYYKAMSASPGVSEPPSSPAPTSCLRTPSILGLGRKDKTNSKLSCQSGMKKSVSFNLRTKRKAAIATKTDASRPSPSPTRSLPSMSRPLSSHSSLENIEVALRTHSSDTTTRNSLPDNVIDFVPDESKPPSGQNALEGNGIKTIGKRLYRVGSRISCRAPSADSDSFQAINSSGWEDTVPFGSGETDMETPIDNTASMDVNNGRVHEESVLPDRPVETPETPPVKEATQDSGSIWDMDVFDDNLDMLLEKVGLGSLALSPPTCTPAHEHDSEASPSIIDTVSKFQL